MLQSINITNFKKHNDLQVDLSPGLNFICGPNYSGKTSLMESILFALGGPGCVPGGSNVAYTRGTKKTEVQVDFGDFHLTRTKSGARMAEDNGEVATGKTAVNNRIRGFLGMPVADFLKCSYMRQGSASQLVTELGANEVNRLVETISGVSEVDNFLGVIREMSSRTVGALSMINIDPDKEASLKKQQLELSQLRDKTEAHLEKLETEKETSSATLRELRELLEMYRKVGNARLRSEAARGNNEQAQGRLQELQAKTTPAVSVEEVGRAEASLKDAREAVSRAEKRYRAAVKYRATERGLETRIKKLQDEVDGHQQEASSALARISELEALIKETKQRKERTAEKLISLQHDIDHLSGALKSGICPECKRPYDDAEDMEAKRAQMEEKKSLAGAERNEASVLADEIHGLETVLASSRGIASTQETYRTLLSQAVGELAELKDQEVPTTTQEEVEAARERYDELNVLGWNLRQSLKQWNDHCKAMDLALSEVEKYSVEADNRKTVVKELEAEVKPLLGKFGWNLSAKYDAIHASYAAKEMAADAAESKARDAAEELAGVRRGLQEAARELEEISANKAILNDLTIRESGLKRLRKFLVDHRARYLESTWNGILSYASEVCKITTGGAITEVIRSEGEFFYRENDEVMPIDAASGSQKTLIGAGLKLALTQNLPAGMGSLLMDEPTSDCDEKHSSALMRFLASAGIQTVVITHREMDMAVGGNVIQLGDAA